MMSNVQSLVTQDDGYRGGCMKEPTQRTIVTCNDDLDVMKRGEGEQQEEGVASGGARQVDGGGAHPRGGGARRRRVGRGGGGRLFSSV